MNIYTVSVFKSVKSGVIFMFPMGFNKDGIRIGLNKFSIFNPPFHSEEIGAALKKCFSITINKEYSPADYGSVFDSATGIKSYKRFVKEYTMLSVQFNPEVGYIISPQQRAKDNSYVPLEYKSYDSSFNKEVSEIELGKAVEKAFNYAK